MKFLLAFFALLALTESSPVGYIINGITSEEGRWPWQVSLQINKNGSWVHECGGSLIKKNWVLTAANCVYFDPSPSNYLVKLGGVQLSAGDFEQTFEIAQIIMHSWFTIDYPGGPRDIALLRLDGDANLNSSNIGLVSLPEEGQTFAGNDNCYITGWGVHDRTTTPRGSREFSDTLREAHVPVYTHEECERMFGGLRFYLPVYQTHICTGDPSPEVDIHACFGDAGGPLVCDVSGSGNGSPDWRLAGVSSRGGNLECSLYPSVYTRVTSFLDWINLNAA